MATDILDQTKYWHLKSFDLLACLTDPEIRELSQMAGMEVLHRGKSLYLPGDSSDRVFLLKSGLVKLSRITDDGKRLTLDLVGPGELFGEHALVGAQERQDGAEVVQDAVVCTFDREAFEEFLKAHPDLALRVTKLIGYRLRRVETKIHDLLFKDVRTRLAHTLARLAREYGEPRDDGSVRIDLDLTQTDLAQLIGSTRETTSTAFNEFRRDGLVETKDREIVVIDPEALAAH